MTSPIRSILKPQSRLKPTTQEKRDDGRSSEPSRFGFAPDQSGNSTNDKAKRKERGGADYRSETSSLGFVPAQSEKPKSKPEKLKDFLNKENEFSRQDIIKFIKGLVYVVTPSDLLPVRVDISSFIIGMTSNSDFLSGGYSDGAIATLFALCVMYLVRTEIQPDLTRFNDSVDLVTHVLIKLYPDANDIPIGLNTDNRLKQCRFNGSEIRIRIEDYKIYHMLGEELQDMR